jgi:xanthine/uracil/vitamin C permease (AzgA family)
MPQRAGEQSCVLTLKGVLRSNSGHGASRESSGVRWDDLGEAIPAFLTLVTMPLSLSIADGLAVGFISHALLQALGGRAHKVSWLGYLFALLFLLRLVLS